MSHPREAEARALFAGGAGVREVARRLSMRSATAGAIARAAGLCAVQEGRRRAVATRLRARRERQERNQRLAEETMSGERTGMPKVEMRKALNHTLYCLDGDCEECIRIEEAMESAGELLPRGEVTQ